MGHLLEAIKGSTLSLAAALKSHAKLNAMRDEDLFAGLPEGTLCVCVCTLHFPLFGACVAPAVSITSVVCRGELRSFECCGDVIYERHPLHRYVAILVEAVPSLY